MFQRSLFDAPQVPGQGELLVGPERKPLCRPKDLQPGPENEFSGIDDLEVLKKLVLDCARCPLRKGAKNVVFGKGNPQARIMFVGEGPGRTEDESGEPFVGRAGNLLDLFLKPCGISREDVFISNVVKCRPPGNRLPNAKEVQACLPNLKAQIRIIKPKIILVLGALAAQTLIDPSLRVTRDRGKWFEKDGIAYLVTFHPAAVLRDEARRKEPVLKDFESLKRRYEMLPKQGDTR